MAHLSIECEQLYPRNALLPLLMGPGMGYRCKEMLNGGGTWVVVGGVPKVLHPEYRSEPLNLFAIRSAARRVGWLGWLLWLGSCSLDGRFVLL